MRTKALKGQPGEARDRWVTGSPRREKTLVVFKEASETLHKGNRLRATNGRKLVEELVERLAAFEVIEQGLGRDSGSEKDGRSTKDVGVAVYYRGTHDHRSTSVDSYQ